MKKYSRGYQQRIASRLSSAERIQPPGFTRNKLTSMQSPQPSPKPTMLSENSNQNMSVLSTQQKRNKMPLRQQIDEIKDMAYFFQNPKNYQYKYNENYDIQEQPVEQHIQEIFPSPSMRLPKNFQLPKDYAMLDKFQKEKQKMDKLNQDLKQQISESNEKNKLLLDEQKKIMAELEHLRREKEKRAQFKPDFVQLNQGISILPIPKRVPIHEVAPNIFEEEIMPEEREEDLALIGEGEQSDENEQAEEQNNEIMEALEQEVAGSDEDLGNEEGQAEHKEMNMKFEQNFDDDEEEENKFLSYVNLKSQIAQRHPTDEQDTRYSMTHSMGSFPLMLPLDRKGQPFIQVSEIQMSIGLGPCLMLLTTKALAFLFLLLTLINTPIFLFYNFGRSPENGLTKDNVSLSNIFYKLSIGNLGQREFICDYSELKDSGFEDIEFKCNYGQITDLVSLGIPKDGSSCQTSFDLMRIYEQESQNTTKINQETHIQEGCNHIDDLINSNKLITFKTQFNKECIGKHQCSFNFKKYQQDFSSKCRDILERNKRYGLASIRGFVLCDQEFIEVPFTTAADNVKIRKSDLSNFIILSDFLVMIILISFGIWIERRQSEFIDAFKEQAIQMDDYAIKISNLPDIKLTKCDEHVLRAKLLKHFHDLFQNEIFLEWEAAIQQQIENIKDSDRFPIDNNHKKKLSEELKVRKAMSNPLDYTTIELLSGSQDQNDLPLNIVEGPVDISDGSVYNGQYLQDPFKRQGYGYWINPEGTELYEGQFKNDKIEGYGRIFKKDGLFYQGQWKNNLYDDKGTISWYQKKDGQNLQFMYKGQFKEGKKQGLGVLVLQSPTSQQKKYIGGQWDKDKIIGDYTVTLREPDGKFLEKELGNKNFKPELLDEMEFEILEQFLNDIQERKNAKIDYLDEHYSYFGQTDPESGLKSGYGVVEAYSKFQNQRIYYQGNWKDDQPHGIGQYFAVSILRKQQSGDMDTYTNRPNQFRRISQLINPNINFDEEIPLQKGFWYEGDLIFLLGESDLSGPKFVFNSEELLDENIYDFCEKKVEDLGKDEYVEKKMKDFEIVDICFGERQTTELEFLAQIYPIFQEVKIYKNYARHQNCLLQKTRNLYHDYNHVKREEFAQKATEFYEQVSQETDDVKNWLGPKYAFITFRRIPAREKAEKMYNIKFIEKIKKRLEVIKLQKKIKQRSEQGNGVVVNFQQNKKLGGKLIRVSNGGLPVEINWLNIKYNTQNRFKRKLFMFLISGIAIFLGFSFLVYFQKVTQEASKIETEGCEQTKIEIKKGIIDQFGQVGDEEFEKFYKRTIYLYMENQFDNKLSNKAVDCYCVKQGSKNITAIENLDFSDVGGNLDHQGCMHIIDKQKLGNLIIFGSGLVITTINAGLKAFFQKFQYFEKNHSKADDTIALFWKFTIMQFLNIAVIQLIIGMNLRFFKNFYFLGFIQIFQGNYNDFNIKWYKEVGATLGTTITIKIYGSHTKYINKFIQSFVKRCLDRGCKYSANKGKTQKSFFKIPKIPLFTKKKTVSKQVEQQQNAVQNELKHQFTMKLKDIKCQHHKQEDDHNTEEEKSCSVSGGGFKFRNIFSKKDTQKIKDNEKIQLTENEQAQIKKQITQFQKTEKINDEEGFQFRNDDCQKDQKYSELSQTKDEFDFQLKKKEPKNMLNQSQKSSQEYENNQKEGGNTESRNYEEMKGQTDQETNRERYETNRSIDQNREPGDDKYEFKISVIGMSRMNDLEIEDLTPINLNSNSQNVNSNNDYVIKQFQKLNQGEIFQIQISETSQNFNLFFLKTIKTQNQFIYSFASQQENCDYFEGEIVIFDCNDEDSFRYAQEQLSVQNETPVQKVLIGIYSSSHLGRIISYQQGKQIADQNGSLFFEEDISRYPNFGPETKVNFQSAQQILVKGMERIIRQVLMNIQMNTFESSDDFSSNRISPVNDPVNGTSLRPANVALREDIYQFNSGGSSDIQANQQIGQIPRGQGRNNVNQQQINSVEGNNQLIQNDINQAQNQNHRNALSVDMSSNQNNQQFQSPKQTFILETDKSIVSPKYPQINMQNVEFKGVLMKKEKLMQEDDLLSLRAMDTNRPLNEPDKKFGSQNKNYGTQIRYTDQMTNSIYTEVTGGALQSSASKQLEQGQQQEQEAYTSPVYTTEEGEEHFHHHNHGGGPCHKIKLKITGLLWKFLAKKEKQEKEDCDLRTKCATQEDVLNLYTGQELQSFDIYGELITIYWCCIMFSSGMPVLYFVGFLYYTAFYFIYKMLILKFFATPQTFNQNLSINATNMIHFAIVWHIIIASLMYSNSRIMGKSHLGHENYFAHLVVGLSNTFKRRFSTQYSIDFIGWCCILVLIYIVALVMVKSVQFIYTIISECTKQQNDEMEKEDTSGYYKDLNFNELKNINKRVKEERKKGEIYLKVFEKDVERNELIRTQLKETLNEEEIDLYRKWLKQRVNSIKGIIKFHFRDLMFFIRKNMQKITKERIQNKENSQNKEQQMIEEQEMRDKEQRLRVLIKEMELLLVGQDDEGRANQYQKKKNDKKASADDMIQKFQEVVNKLRFDRINYTNPKCFQLTDLIQSFSMYDSDVFKQAKEVRDFLEKQFIENQMPLKRKSAKRYIKLMKEASNPLQVPYWFVESKQANKLNNWIENQEEEDEDDIDLDFKI